MQRAIEEILEADSLGEVTQVTHVERAGLHFQDAKHVSEISTMSSASADARGSP